MKKREITIVGVLLVVYSTLVYPQGSQPPKPGPEHKKLAVFLGSWSVEGEYKVGNGYGAPAGKTTQVERWQWLPGEFFIQMNREGKGPAGDFRHTIIWGYDARSNKYTVAVFNLTAGASSTGTITNTGNTWMISSNGHGPDGRPFQERCTLTIVPNASYTVKCETSTDGKNWSPSWEEKATKLKL